MQKYYLLFLNLIIVTAGYSQPFDGFFSLDGKDDYAESRSTPIPDDTDFTIELFFKPCNSSGALIDARGSTAGSGIDIYLSTYNLKVTVKDNSTNTSGSATVSNIWDQDKWYHVAVTHREADSVNTIFINGENMDEFKAPFEAISKMVIGKADHADYSFFGGYIDELRISNVERYTEGFTVPVSDFSVDENTVALFKFNEGQDEMTTFQDEVGEHDLTGYRGAHTNGPVFVSEDQNIDVGEETQLNAGGGTIFAWTPKESLNDSSLADPMASPITTTQYHVTVSDSNNCEDHHSVTINVTPVTDILKPSVYIRNSVFPNPALGNKVQYRYRVENHGNVSIALYNALGNKVSTIKEGYESQGEHTVTIDIPDKGLFYLMFDSEEYSETQSIIRN